MYVIGTGPGYLKIENNKVHNANVPFEEATRFYNIIECFHYAKEIDTNYHDITGFHLWHVTYMVKLNIPNKNFIYGTYETEEEAHKECKELNEYFISQAFVIEMIRSKV